MTTIQDFTDEEIELIQKSLMEKFGRPIETYLVDTELRLNPASSDLTLCPGVYWEAEGCNFIINKVGDSQYHCRFFYSENEQFNAGQPFSNDLMDCVTVLLRSQPDRPVQKRT